MSPASRTAAAARAGRPVVHRAAAAAARRALAGLPGVLRAAGGELPHGHRADHQRGLRLHGDAHQPAARRAAHAHRRWRSTSRGRPSAPRRTPSTRPTAPARPTSSAARSTLIKDVLGALGIPVDRPSGFEADDIIATLATQAEADGFRVLIVTGDRDASSSSTTTSRCSTRRKGSPTSRRFDPRRGDEQVRAHARPSTPTSRRCAATRATTCPASPGGGEDGRQVGPRVRLAHRAHRPGRRGQGQGGRRAARAPGQRAAQPAAHRAGARRPAGRPPGELRTRGRGTGRRSTGSSTS